MKRGERRRHDVPGDSDFSGSRHLHVASRRQHGWAAGRGAAAHLRKNEQIEEVHDAEDDENQADFGAEDFQGGAGVGGLVAVFQGECDVADVDEVKADDQEVIDRIGQRRVAVKAVHEEDSTVAVQGAGHPDRQTDADDQIREVGDDGGGGSGFEGGEGEERVHGDFSFQVLVSVISVMTEI